MVDMLIRVRLDPIGDKPRTWIADRCEDQSHWRSTMVSLYRSNPRGADN